MITPNTPLEHALAYLSLGWAVLPCKVGQKVPATRHGVKDATKDAKQVTDWWTEHQEYNIALACGEISGVCALDLDFDEEKRVNGWLTLSRLPEEQRGYFDTLQQMTPRGGAHFLYRLPPQGTVPNKSELLHGIGLRSNGCYIVLSPSVHPNGKCYQWADNRSPWTGTLRTFPEALLPKITTPSWTPSRYQSIAKDSEYIVQRAAAYLHTCDPAVQGQGGHSKLLWAAVSLVHGFLLPDRVAYDLLASHYNPLCDPPWNLQDKGDHADFCRKISEARKLSPQRPPGWLLMDDLPDDAMSDEELQLFIENSIEEANTKAIASATEANVTPIKPHLGPSKDVELKFLLNPTGLLGEICAWINRSAFRSQPYLTLGCALAFLGTLFGRKIRDEADSRTNLYCMGIAPSSAGKNHAPRMIMNLCAEAGCLDLLGGSEFASDVSIETRLQHNPSTLFLCDEIGFLLAAVKNTRNPFTYKIVSTLMKLYSAANGVYIGREYKDTANRIMVDQPCCSLFGFSTPERFFNALSPEELQDGWLSRCLVFYSGTRPAKRRGVRDCSIPHALAKKVNDWYIRGSNQMMGAGQLNQVLTSFSSGFSSRVTNLMTIPTTPEAEIRFVQLDADSETAGRHNPEVAVLWAKAEENARRIGLIVAAGNRFENPVIDIAEADYACRLIYYLLQDFSGRVARISDNNEIAKTKLRLYTLIDNAGVHGLSRAELIRQTRWLSKNHREANLSDLEAGGDVVSVMEGTRGAKRYFSASNAVKCKSCPPRNAS